MTYTYALNIMDTLTRASDNEVVEGLHWYDKTRELANEWADGDIWKGAGVIAAYSPLTPWWRNLQLAKDSLLTGIANPKSLGSNVRKAQAILDGAPVLPTLNGPKLTAFASAIADPDSRLVTVDQHAYSVAMGEHFFTRNAKFGVRVYRDIAQAYTECADFVGIAPYQLQAITWVTWRNAHPGPST